MVDKKQVITSIIISLVEIGIRFAAYFFFAPFVMEVFKHIFIGLARPF